MSGVKTKNLSSSTRVPHITSCRRFKNGEEIYKIRYAWAGRAKPFFLLIKAIYLCRTRSHRRLNSVRREMQNKIVS